MASIHRYHLVASFDPDASTTNTLYDQRVDTITARIPFLDFGGRFRYGLQTAIDEYHKMGIHPSEAGFDAITLGMMVYIADMKVSRLHQSQDCWTRELRLTVPVHDRKWESHTDTLERMLRFLTGDLWSIEFVRRDFGLSQHADDEERTDKYRVASLFSGGMDSLIAAINYLESGRPTLLVSHAGEGRVRHSQVDILGGLDELYGEVPHENAYLWTGLTDIELPFSDGDMNQRSRSFLFIAIALFAMSGMSGCTRLMMPENGLIALNVPLDVTRVGSHSTRTTHPFYLGLWNEIVGDVFGYSIENPYWNKTKGEMAASCLNKAVLWSLLGKSFSCSSVNSASIRSGISQHCGHCLPCIIRRAAIYKAFGREDPSQYMYARVQEVRENRGPVGEQLRSFEYAIERLRSRPQSRHLLIHVPGPLVGDSIYLSELADLYWRGMMEVEDWMTACLEAEDAS